MKTKHFLVLSLVLSMSISVLQAQVRIGDLSAPRSGVSLDLNRNDNTATTGLGLPRVNLVGSQDPRPLATSFENLNGVMVYNLSTVDGDLSVGPYFASPNGWIKILQGSDATNDKDIVLLDPLPATVWLGADGNTERILTITTTIDNEQGVTLSYQWYYLTLDLNAQPQPISGATLKTFTIPKGTDANHKLKTPGEIKKYFCVVRNGSKSVVTTRVRAVYGNGVFLNGDQWLNVLNYNLGATDDAYKAKTPTEQYLETSYDEKFVGYLYQWGRAADGHELRSNTNYYSGVLNSETGVSVDASSGQVTTSQSDIYGKFILRNAGTYDWRQYGTENASNPPAAWIHDPCSSLKNDNKTWRLPTSSEWSQIYSNNYTENTGKGLRFRPDGKETSVFLPAAGYRYRFAGELVNMSSNGYYWSSTPSGTNALGLTFTANTVSPTLSNVRSYGFSVRCVAE